METHLHPQVLEEGDTLRDRDASRRTADHRLVDAAPVGVVADVEAAEQLFDLDQSVSMVIEPGPIDQPLLDQHCHHRREAERVGAGAHLEVEVGELGGLGPTRIEDNHAACGIVGDLFQHRAGVGDAVGLPRILSDEYGDLGVLDIAAHHRPEHPPIDEELACLFLRERTRSVHRAECTQRRPAVAPTEVVALATTAVVQDALAAVRVTDCGEPLGHFTDRGVPIDLLERAIGATSQR